MTRAAHALIVRSQNSEVTIHKVIQVMLEYEETPHTPDHVQLRDTFYEVLFIQDREDLAPTAADLKNVWECLTNSLVCSGAKSKPVEEQPQEEKVMMNKNVPLAKVTYVYGEDINDLDKKELMTAIVKAKEEIKDLEDVGVESTYIKEQIEDLNKVITLIVKQLDK